MKKSIGIALLVLGVIVGAIGFYQQSQDNKILEIGKLEVKKDATENINMMMIAGVVLAVGGIVVVAVGKK
jgi:hypothetical protein